MDKMASYHRRTCVDGFDVMCMLLQQGSYACQSTIAAVSWLKGIFCTSNLSMIQYSDYKLAAVEFCKRKLTEGSGDPSDM